jgi:hypothetical protein
MLLVTCNAEGELKPLEIGLHALKAVPEGKGGRGKKGGLSEYARSLGLGESYIRQLRDAAEVFKTSHLSAKFRDMAKHLAAIHALPAACWPECRAPLPYVAAGPQSSPRRRAGRRFWSVSCWGRPTTIRPDLGTSWSPRGHFVSFQAGGWGGALLLFDDLKRFDPG